MKVMGIINVTPDSFSDRGLYFDPEAAVAHGHDLLEAGADVLDIGGESTRPGADPVAADEEIRRVVPVIEALAGSALISIDTGKAEVAAAAVAAGASMVNDVTAFRGDPGMAAVCAESAKPDGSGVEVVLMHMLGTPRTMQRDPRYDDVVAEVSEFLLERVEAAEAAGIDRKRIWIDPGIGFGKTVEHNLRLLRATGRFSDAGLPVLVGPSRKAFIGRIDGSPESERVGGTIAACLAAADGGAAMVRVHDVAPVVQALKVRDAVIAA